MLNNRSMEVVGIMQDEVDPMLNAMGVRGSGIDPSGKSLQTFPHAVMTGTGPGCPPS